MPKVTNFAFCEKPMDEDNPRTINFLEIIETAAGSFSFAIMFSITGFTSNENHDGYIVLLDMNNKKLVETDKFTIDKEESGMEEEGLITGISMGVEFGNILFQGPGLYKIELYFDGDMLGEFSIPVTFKREDDDYAGDS